MATALLTQKPRASVFGRNRSKTKSDDQIIFGKKVGLMTKLFGCWHENISRPFVQEQTAYRCCLQCGARKRFDPETLKTYGAFYFPPAVKTEDSIF
jgi:hypothetical protein